MTVKIESGRYSEPAPIANERNDCGVRALMTAACVDYITAHTACEHADRKPRDGMTQSQMNHALHNLFGTAAPVYVHMPVLINWCQRRNPFYASHNNVMYKKIKRTTLTKFIKANLRGHYIVYVPYHYIAICDGVVHDWNYGKRGARLQRGVIGYWKLV